MEHNNDIEEFSGGGRISPESSATDFPKGTLGVGKNGNVWINQPDKNGRLSWKATENDFPISSIFSFGYWDDENFNFQIKLDGKEFFKLKYAYNYENSYLVFTYPNGGADREILGSLDELLDFFNDNFVAKTFDDLNTNDNINGTKILTEVKILFSRLKFLINNKGLRSPKKSETPDSKFKIGDKVKLPTTKEGTTIYSGTSMVWDDAMKNNQKYLVVTKVWDNTIMLDTDLSKYGDYFSQELDKLELYEEALKPKFKLNDLVRRLGSNVIYKIIEVDFADTQNGFEYTLKSENDDEFYSSFEDRLELADETPKRKFNSQDKVRELGNKRVMTVSSYIYDRTAKQWKYTLTYDDNKKTAQFFENGLELALEEKIPEPKFKEGDKVKIKGNPNEYEIVKEGFYVKELSNYKYNVKAILGGSIYEQYESDLELIEEVPEPKFKIGDKVVKKGKTQVMTVVKQIYDQKQKMFDYNLKFDNGKDTDYFEDELEFFENESKFKIGDIVKVIGGFNYYEVFSIFVNSSGKYLCRIKNLGNDDESVSPESDLEIVEATPLTPFQKIDFLSPSTEENEVLIKGMQNYSDGLTFINSTLANVRLTLKDRIAYIEVLFDKVNDIIKISEPSRNIQTFSTEIRRKITNERLEEITELYIQTLAKMITKMESETPPQDCEADPSLIVSDQVKRFYDLNKNKINKLNEQFSCKIIKALVSLSDYEKCGTPSTKTLKQPKSDLLSRISQLKL